MKIANDGEEFTDKLPEKLFRLRHELLLPGDIIASTVPDSIPSKIIRWYTDGEFSHVALCFMKNVLIEALGQYGVIISVPNRVFAENMNNIAVFRPKEEIVKAPHFETRLVAECFETWLSGYALSKISCVVFPKAPFKATTDKYFCSELVSRVYLNCGVTLSEGLKPEQTAPKALYASKQLRKLDNDILLEEVTEAQFRLLYMKGGFVVSDVPQKSSDMSLESEMHSSLQQLASNAPDAKSGWDFRRKQIEFFTKLNESKLKTYISSDSRWKDLKEIFLGGMAEKKINIYNQCTATHLESMEYLRILVQQRWKVGSTDNDDVGANEYLVAVQRLIGLMYINEMMSKEDSRYLEVLQKYSAENKDIDDAENDFQNGVRFY